MKVKSDHGSRFSNLSNKKRTSLKKNQGFNRIRTRDLRDTGAMLYLLSYEATHWSEVNSKLLSLFKIIFYLISNLSLPVCFS